jgi:hypothetical protein
MKPKIKLWLALPLLTVFSLISAASYAATFTGEAVSGGGIDDGPVGLTPSSSGVIEYFIPLGSSYTGTYGENPSTCGGSGVGTCADYGSGYGYEDDSITALKMNIFFDLNLEPASNAADIAFIFDDLDLKPNNDPRGFLESVSFSYWNVDSNTFIKQGSTITEESQLDDLPGSSFTVLDVNPNDDFDPILWNLDLATLGILADFNKSVAEEGGFWIQLGFDSKYVKWWDEAEARNGTNTSEFLSAELTVSPVPLPSAVWLFGSALLGFISMSRRTRV